MLHEGLKTELLTNTGTLALLGPGRVFPLVIPQKVPKGALQVPAVVYTVTNAERQVTHCGTSGLIRTTMRLDCYATTYDVSRELAAAVISTLLDFSGSLGGTVDVRTATLESEFDVQDFEPGLFRVSQSWNFWHTE